MDKVFDRDAGKRCVILFEKVEHFAHGLSLGSEALFALIGGPFRLAKNLPGTRDHFFRRAIMASVQFVPYNLFLLDSQCHGHFGILRFRLPAYQVSGNLRITFLLKLEGVFEMDVAEERAYG